ncbi:MAG: T9SS type A sorting domain-containing protein [Bacteroidia bacterium]|nr:T9SS type A sorting domain-containing protein [Bacteroidia bacterium]
MFTQKTCTLFLFFVLMNAHAQNNLVPNGSFETYTAYPYTLNQINCTGNWYAPTKGYTDYFHMLAQVDFIGVPNNFLGFQKAYNNQKAYAGIIAYGSLDYDTTDTLIYRSYLQTKLDSPLIAGKTYYLSFNVNLADSARTAGDGMGAYFSQTPVTLDSSVTNLAAPLNFTPQVSNSPGNFLNDKTNWKRISGTFVASGGEEYITIGNFKDNDSTSIQQMIPYGLGYQNFAYYYIDEICLSLSSETCAEHSLGLTNYNSNVPSFYYSAYTDKIIFKDVIDDYNVVITDMCGKIIRNIHAKGLNEIDVADLEPGCYFVDLSNQNSKATRKIIIE